MAQEARVKSAEDLRPVILHPHPHMHATYLGTRGLLGAICAYIHVQTRG